MFTKHCSNTFMKYVSQVIILNTLNLYSDACQLYLIKISKKSLFKAKFIIYTIIYFGICNIVIYNMGINGILLLLYF